MGGRSLGWALPGFELWTVDRRRPSAGAQDFDAWIPSVDALMGRVHLAMAAQFSRDVAEDYPFGEVNLRFSAGLDPAGLGAQVYQGFLESFGGPSGAGFNYYERRGDVGMLPLAGERFEEVQTRVEISAGALAGEARVFRRTREDRGLGDSGIQAEEWLLAFDGTHLLRGQSGGAPEAFRLSNPTRHVWRYGLYQPPGAGGGQRFQPATGFGVRDSRGVYGFYEAGALWMSDGGQVVSGERLDRDLYVQAEAQSYTTYTAPGRLWRLVRHALPLARVAGECFQWIEYDSGADQSELFEVAYDAVDGNWERVARFDGASQRFVALVPVQAIDVAGLGYLRLESESLGGMVSFVDGFDEVSWFEQELVDGSDVIFSGGATELVLRGFVDSPRPGLTQAQALAGDLFLPAAAQGAPGQRYVFRQSDFTLQHDASGSGNMLQPVLLASGVRLQGSLAAGGVISGPLLPDGLLPATPAEAWRQPSFYVWETGPNPWNRLVGLQLTGGAFLDIPPAVRFEYVHSSAADRNGDASQAGRTFILEWSPANGLRGIPRQGVDQDGDGALDRFFPALSLADGTSLGPAGAAKVLKALLVEEVLQPDPSYTGNLALFGAGDLTVPNLGGFSAPGLGRAPVLGEAPRVVDAQED